jgi:separase
VVEARPKLVFFSYLGHGDGGFGEIYESRAAIVMLGCSSVSLLPRNHLITLDEFHERSSLLSYLLAGCPAVVGCLWSVESDIERLAIALVEQLPKAPGQTCLLGEALVKAKAACEYPYFTGGAVVVYGLPVRFFAGSATAHWGCE